MESTFVMVQMESVEDPMKNLKKAAEWTEKAVKKFHPDFLVFPETVMAEFQKDTSREERRAAAQPLDGSFVRGMQELSRTFGVWMVFGMQETVEDPGDARSYNTTVMLNDRGSIVQVYRKTHMYDAFGYEESAELKPGDRFFEPVSTPFGTIGLFVCYEVRFPEVARHQRAKGAEIILMPTAWVKGDMKSLHFRTLVTARAIENTVFLLACDQYSRIRMGESLAVDPMGVTLASAGEGEQLIPVYIDTDRIASIRRKLPSYEDRRPELYRDLCDA